MNVVAFVISFGLFVAGLWMFGEAFGNPDTAIYVFTGGILLITLAIFIPFQILGISKKDNQPPL
ncbi:MAG: hypothetical protein ACOYBP_00850 [Microbacteriaceae bacterium]